MAATTTQGRGNGAVERVKPKLYNGVVRTGNIAPGAITVSSMRVFKSIVLTGNGEVQNIAHGLGVMPGLVMVYPVDTSPADAGVYASSEGEHTSESVVVTVTLGKKYRVVAFA
jgi:predicted Kef-type K+ transport protein